MPSLRTLTDLEVNTFYTVRLESEPGPVSREGKGYLLPVRPLRAGTALEFVEIQGSRMQNLPIKVFRAINPIPGADSETAFLITSRFQVENFHTGLVQVFRSWQENVDNPVVSQNEVFTALKLPGLYVYHATNKITLVTIPDLNEKLEDLLLAI